MTKRLLTTFAIGSLLLMMGCSSVPKIEDVEEDSKEGVERLLTEDNNDKLTYRLDRYFLSEQVDDLTYKGTMKATAFRKSQKFDSYRLEMVQVTDSTKLYRNVIIKFRDKRYDFYTISISRRMNVE